MLTFWTVFQKLTLCFTLYQSSLGVVMRWDAKVCIGWFVSIAWCEMLTVQFISGQQSGNFSFVGFSAGILSRNAWSGHHLSAWTDSKMSELARSEAEMGWVDVFGGCWLGWNNRFAIFFGHFIFSLYFVLCEVLIHIFFIYINNAHDNNRFTQWNRSGAAAWYWLGHSADWIIFHLKSVVTVWIWARVTILTHQ